MTSQDRYLIRRALELLHRLVPDDEPHVCDYAPRPCPVGLFSKRYLKSDLAQDVTTAELWQFYSEIATAGELPVIKKTVFLRALTDAIEATLGMKKCHTIERAGRKVRGFRGIDMREDARPVTTLELEPE